MKKVLLLILFIVSIISCKDESKVAELGKPIPNYKFTNILNSEKSSISLNDLKGKPIILEFCSTWCDPCIPAMRKLDSLQKAYGNKIEIITVSIESKERLEKFIRNTKTDLQIVSDTMHSDIFKYKVIPHTILIDKKGISVSSSNWNAHSFLVGS